MAVPPLLFALICSAFLALALTALFDAAGEDELGRLIYLAFAVLFLLACSIFGWLALLLRPDHRINLIQVYYPKALRSYYQPPLLAILLPSVAAVVYDWLAHMKNRRYRRAKSSEMAWVEVETWESRLTTRTGSGVDSNERA